MKTRLYVVHGEINGHITHYLVDAVNVNGAIRHVAKRHISAKTADGKTVARLMAAGIKPESAAPESDEAVPFA